MHEPLNLTFGAAPDTQMVKVSLVDSRWKVNVDDADTQRDDSKSQKSGKSTNNAESDPLEMLSEGELFKRKESLKQRLTEMIDSRDRLTVHAFVLRLCLANGLLMYH